MVSGVSFGEDGKEGGGDGVIKRTRWRATEGPLQMEPLCLGDGVFRRSKVPRFQGSKSFSRSRSGEPGREGTDGT